MKITAILVLRTPEAASSSAGEEQQQAVVLANASDMSRFRFFQRPAARDTIVLVARTIALRTAASRRHLTVQQGHEGYKVHCYNQNGLCAVVFTDEHYPDRSAHSILIEVLEEHEKNFGGSWRTAKEDATQTWEYLDHALTKYQDPAEADKIILNKIAQNMLQIGEPLDSLAEKCSELSAAAQMFYKPVKKTNSYCTISRGDTLMAIGAMALPGCRPCSYLYIREKMLIYLSNYPNTKFKIGPVFVWILAPLCTICNKAQLPRAVVLNSAVARSVSPFSLPNLETNYNKCYFGL